MLKAMKNTILPRVALSTLAFCATALPALADTQFRLRPMMRDDVPLGKGQCDIRLQVDGEAEVAVRGDVVTIRTISGRDPYDDGNSECNAPLPNRDLENFRFEVRDSRNDIRLLAEPSRRNGFAAVVLIRDSSGGQGRYHFRLTWQMTGNDYRPGGRPGGGFEGRPGGFDNGRGGGFSWNNTVSFRGDGRGVANYSGPFGDRRLNSVNVDIDRNGRIVVSFRADRAVLTFNGFVTGREGGRLRADVMSEDRRLRGPMFLSVDNRERVDSINLEATDGRERLRLNWDRR